MFAPWYDEKRYIQSMVTTGDTVAILSIAVVLYSLIILRRGLLHYLEESFSGVLIAGYANRLPNFLNKQVPKRLSAIIINLPGVVIPIIMYIFTMKYSNFMLLLYFIGHYVVRLAIGVSVNGSSVNISEVLVEYTLNIIFAYCQSASLCYLENYDHRSMFEKVAHIIGVVLYGTGICIYLFHEYQQKMAELVSKTQFPYVKGWLFNYTASPQHFGEILLALGMFLSTGTAIAAAQFLFTLCHSMVLANTRLHEIKTWHEEEIDKRLKGLLPFVW